MIMRYSGVYIYIYYIKYIYIFIYYIYIYYIYLNYIYIYRFTMEDHHYLEDHPTDRNCLVTVVMTIAQLQMG